MQGRSSLWAFLIAGALVLIGAVGIVVWKSHSHHDDLVVLNRATPLAASKGPVFAVPKAPNAPGNGLVGSGASAAPSVAFDLTKPLDTASKADANSANDSLIQSLENTAVTPGRVGPNANAAAQQNRAATANQLHLALSQEPSSKHNWLPETRLIPPQGPGVGVTLTLDSYIAADDPLVRATQALDDVDHDSVTQDSLVDSTSQSLASDPVFAWAKGWESDVINGRPCRVGPTDPEVLAALQKTALPCDKLHYIGKVVGFVCGAETSIPFYAASVGAAEKLFDSSSPAMSAEDGARIGQVLGGIGHQAVSAHDYALGARAYRVIMRIPSEDPDKTAWATVAYAKCKHLAAPSDSEVIDMLQKVVGQSPADRASLLQVEEAIALAQILYDGGSYQQAADALQAQAGSLVNIPAIGVAQVLLIKSYAKAGHPENATNLFNEWSQRHAAARFESMKSDLSDFIGAAASSVAAH